RYAYVADTRSRYLLRLDLLSDGGEILLQDFDSLVGWADNGYLYFTNDLGEIDSLNFATDQVRTVIPPNAGLYVPTGIWGDGTYLYVPDLYNCIIQKITISNGQMFPLAGHVPNCR